MTEDVNIAGMNTKSKKLNDFIRQNRGAAALTVAPKGKKEKLNKNLTKISN